MPVYGPFPENPYQMPLRSLAPRPATPAAAMQQRWQNPMGEYANTPMQQPTMASVRTKRIFGINVPQRTIQSVVGGLAAGLAAGADGNFAEGFAGGLGGALGGGMLYDRQMRLEQEAAAQAERQAQQAAIDERRVRVDEGGLRLRQQQAMREAQAPTAGMRQPTADEVLAGMDSAMFAELLARRGQLAKATSTPRSSAPKAPSVRENTVQRIAQVTGETPAMVEFKLSTGMYKERVVGRDEKQIIDEQGNLITTTNYRFGSVGTVPSHGQAAPDPLGLRK